MGGPAGTPVTKRDNPFGRIEDLVSEQQYKTYGTAETRSYFWAPDVKNYWPTVFFPRV